MPRILRASLPAALAALASAVPAAAQSGASRREATNVTSTTHTGVEMTFVTGLVAAGPLRTHSYPARR